MKTPIPFRPDKVLAGILFLAMAAIEAQNDLSGTARAGLMPAANIFGLILVPIWLTAGAVLLLRRPIAFRPHVVSIGIVASIMHGAFLRVGRTGVAGPSGGALFIAAAFVLLIVLLPTMRHWLAARGLVGVK